MKSQSRIALASFLATCAFHLLGCAPIQGGKIQDFKEFAQLLEDQGYMVMSFPIHEITPGAILLLNEKGDPQPQV